MGLSQHGDLVSDILATPPCKAPSKGAVGEPSPAEQPNDRLGLFMHTQRKVVNGINQASPRQWQL